MIYLSLDASSTAIGWSVFDEDNLLKYGKVVPTITSKIYYERIINMIPQLHKIMKEYKPQKCYIENVPLMDSRANSTLVTLGCVQGALCGICASHNVEIEFINVGTWRHNIGLFDGSKESKNRDHLKVKSIEFANKRFNLDLPCVFTKKGNYDAKKSADDIADSINLFCSTRNKYKAQYTKFGYVKR
jgi:Holliday junction resolvasome RuvABC endonuclease subunit